MFNPETGKFFWRKIRANHWITGRFQEWFEVDDLFGAIAKAELQFVAGHMFHFDKINYYAFGESPLIR